ncbi:probable LRR receptor-like serine/threonine-protein kinase At3g47570 [Rosa rugosa]|uniref:probable LRR receptor-like serine/threonine-protein kinase At3g47570 n=1 Tax=Rosa rugosa TaxID=74645 RepID=UPI002B40E861|nr:probable LRR receptor-like serine/threonine-protein kinase At3g47570 [Rosa rugosa]
MQACKADPVLRRCAGTIPNEIGHLPRLEEFVLGGNNLSGLIPTSIFNMSIISMISLDSNQFSAFPSNPLKAPLPISFRNLSTLLETIELSNCSLRGYIPNDIGNLSSLTLIALDYNLLSGTIPTSVGRLHNLQDIMQLDLSSNSLIGPLSEEKEKGESCNRDYLLASTSMEKSFIPRTSKCECATNGFTESSLLGDGGFGSVYKGTLSDGMEVAIKVFNLQLEGAFASFDTECEMLSNIIRHRNLIKVISCCSQIDFKALVLNYMPNGSLDKWLYFQNFSLDILQRLNILIDVASALEYLHHGYETPIVHCDLKPSNILLDDDMGAHVADFGIAKLLGGGDSMTRTMTLATIGYMAPEYGMEGMVTRRGDVYSFGIVVMETFTRRKPTDEIFAGEMSLKQWVANSLDAGAIVKVVDATLLGIEEDHDFVSKRECLSSVMRLAVGCSAESPEERVNMQEALATLKKIKIKFLKDVGGGVEQPSSSRIRIF